MIVRKYEQLLIDQPSYYAHKQILIFLPPIILILGTIGNILAFIVLRRYSSKISTYAFLSVLAILDLLVLYIGLFRIWISEISGTDLKLQSDFLCKLLVFLGYVCSDSSVWLIVAVTTERYVAVRFPLRANWMCSLKITRIVIFVPIVIIGSINLHFFWTVELTTIQNNTICAAVFEYEDIVNNAWPWVDAIIYSIIPIFIILTLNILIIKRVILAGKNRKCLIQGNNAHSEELRRHRLIEASRKLTIMLLSVTFCFLITTMPNNITLIITALWTNQDVATMADFALAKTVTEMLMYTNHAINFVLYCATGKKFRRQLKHALRCRRRKDYYNYSRNDPNQLLLTTVKESHSNNQKMNFVWKLEWKLVSAVMAILIS